MSDINSPADWKQSARSAQDESRFAEAASAWREVLWLRPDDLEAMSGLVACGEVKAAIEALQASLRRNPDQPRLQYQLGLCWLEVGEWDKAARALACAPEDEDTAAALKRLAQERGHPGTSYARHLFNDYAPRFEQALASLGYQPGRVAQQLAPYLKSNQRIIDLGCGTGLMAPYLRPHAARLVGVDIAEKMLDQARKRNTYDALICGDMAASLDDAWEVIVVADALPYVGDLAPLMQAAAKALVPGGVMALSFEVGALEEGYALQASKRYAHSIAYVKAQCHAVGLEVLEHTPIALRQDRGEPINGAILVVSSTIPADEHQADGL